MQAAKLPRPNIAIVAQAGGLVVKKWMDSQDAQGASAGSHCGLAMQETQHSSSAALPGPSASDIAAAGVVKLTGLEAMSWGLRNANLRKKSLSKVLAPDGKAAAVKEVRWFFAATNADDEALLQHGLDAVAWLIDAIECAPFSPATVKLIHKLLGTHAFTANLDFMDQWEILCEGCQNILNRIGKLALQPLFVQYKLGDRLSDAALRKYIIYHTASPQAVAAGGGVGSAGNGSKPSQVLASPKLFGLLQSRYDPADYATLPERRCLLPVLLLSALLQGQFEAAIKKLQAKLGSWCQAYIAPVKGYARCLVKLYADYYTLPPPRSQWVLDALRCLLTGPNPVAMYAIITEISNTFGGHVQLKTPFSLPAKDRADRSHLLLLNSTVLFTSGKTIGELATGPMAEKVFASFKAALEHGECKSRWEMLVEDGISVLRDKALATVPAQLLVEIQFTLDAIASARGLMHFPYDMLRAGDCKRLYTNFKGAGGEAKDDFDRGEETTLFGPCCVGDLVAVKKLLASGADPNEEDATFGRLPLTVAAEDNHPDVIGCLLSARASVDAASSEDGATALYRAAQDGRVEVAIQLLAAGAEVDKPLRDYPLATPLSVALSLVDIEIVKVLLTAGADKPLATNLDWWADYVELSASDANRAKIVALMK